MQRSDSLLEQAIIPSVAETGIRDFDQNSTVE